jgi:hypothetical protein
MKVLTDRASQLMLGVGYFVRSVLLLAFVFVGCSRSADGPLSFQAPKDWKVQHQLASGLDFYALTASSPEGGLLMFSRWPPLNKPEDIPVLVRKLGDGFREQASKSSGVTSANAEYRVEEFAGKHCQGSSAVFKLSGSNNFMQAMFIMSVDGILWNGQFTGSSDAWKQALSVLKSIRRNG